MFFVDIGQFALYHYYISKVYIILLFILDTLSQNSSPSGTFRKSQIPGHISLYFFRFIMPMFSAFLQLF